MHCTYFGVQLCVKAPNEHITVGVSVLINATQVEGGQEGEREGEEGGRGGKKGGGRREASGLLFKVVFTAGLSTEYSRS